MKYTLHFESGEKVFHTLQDAKQAARSLTAQWTITRGSFVIVTSDDGYCPKSSTQKCLCVIL